MPVVPGSRFGAYEVLAALGAGGMGEVYRARDTRLGRDVALKVLPAEFAQDADRRARFEREARTLAALNHPNIVAIHDVGAEAGVGFVVMELLEGETLRSALTNARTSGRRAIDYGIQIARGLAAAHERGCVHRDLKPENIFVTKDGRLKILDFGLALVTGAAVGPSATVAPTQAQGTAPGTVLGTVGYMSPEQVHGQPADARSDIFALGAILYEMAAGRRAFIADSPAATMSAILRDDPPALSAAGNAIPPPLERIIACCLEKKPEARFHSAHDLAFQLESLALDRSDRGVAPIASPRGWRRPALWVLAGAGLAAIGTVWLLPRASSPGIAPASGGDVMRVAITLPADEPIALARTVPYGIGRPSLALSRDGRFLAYVVERGETRWLKLRPLDRWESVTIPGTEGAFAPFFSPDGEWIGFFTDTHLKKVFREGGAPTILAPASNAFGATWADDGTITFVEDEARKLVRVPASAGPTTTLETSQTLAWQWPHSVGTNLLLSGNAWGRARVLLWRPGQTLTERPLAEGTAPQVSPTGHLIMAGEGTILAAPFDAATMSPGGVARPVLEGVRTESSGNGQFSFSNNGTLAYVAGGSARIGKLVWVDRTRPDVRIPLGESPVRAYGTPSVSPDGTRVAVVVYESGTHLWTYEVASDRWSRLSFDGNAGGPFWSANSEDLFFAGIQGGRSSIFRYPVRGTGSPREVVTDSGPGSLARDAGLIAYTLPGQKGILVHSLATGQSEPAVTSPADAYFPAFSPDGRMLAYTSNETGRAEVWMQRFPATSRAIQVSTTGGEEPVWSSNGRELYYRNGQRWMAVSIPVEPALSLPTPRPLFDGPYVNVPGLSYAIHPDGQRFLMIQEAAPANPYEIRLIFNWFRELVR